jgi:HTH-type transcriptional regulator/antitoxin MqsA
MNCPYCAGQALEDKTLDMPYDYKGESTVIKNVVGQVCPRCGEVFLAHEQARKVSDAMAAFNKKVNAAAVDPEFIRGVRKKLHLDQKEAGEIFGGGVNAFSRYENGKTMPPVALVKLFRLLDVHPEMLSLLR